MTRRRASILASALLLLASGCTSGGEPTSVAKVPPVAAPGGFTILQINDTYKIEGLVAGEIGGLSRVRTLRRRLEAEGRPVLVLHAGDLLFPSVASKFLGGTAMIDALNHLDGSAAHDRLLVATFGNHEFDDPDPGLLLERLAESRFVWLSSNVRFRPEPGAPAEPFSTRVEQVVETLVLDLGGIRVGLLGLTNDDLPRPWLEIDYRDRESRRRLVAATIERLRAEGAEMIVALTHQELGEDEWLAREFPAVDWIVGGHEHVHLSRRVGATGITKADADAKSAIRIDVSRRAGRIEAEFQKLDLVGDEVPPDPEMAGLVARWLVRLESTVRERTGRGLLDAVATTVHALEGVEPAIRGRETALGNFLADVLRERLGTEIAFVNGGAVRVNDDVPAGGTVRVYELEGIFYYDNLPVAFELTGGELLALLERSVSEATLGHGRFLQVSGLRFRYRVRATPEGEQARVEPGEVEVGEAASGRFVPLELGRTYSAASLDYLWEHGSRDGYPLFSAGAGGSSPRRLDRPRLSWRGITEEAIAALPQRRITTRIEGRIVRVEADAAHGAGEGIP